MDENLSPRWQQLSTAQASTLLGWWQSMMLSPAQLTDKKQFPAPSGQKARLKRAGMLQAAMMTQGFRSLWLKLPAPETPLNTMQAGQQMLAWACIASTLVHIKTSNTKNLASASGSVQNGDKPVVSELRFQQLQSAQNEEEFMRRLRRIILQLKGDVSPLAVADDILCWFSEYYQRVPRKADKRIAVRWAMDYYRAASK